MISLRVIDRDTELEGLHPLFLTWWRGHGWEGVPVQALPRLGIMAELAKNDAAPVPIGAVWLYMDNSVGVSMLEWLVTDPAASPRDTLRAIQHLVTFAREEAKRLGYGVMLTTAKQAGLVGILQRQGFIKTDEGMTHLITSL